MSHRPIVAAIGFAPDDFLSLGAVLESADVRACDLPLVPCSEEEESLSAASLVICDADRLDWATALRRLHTQLPQCPVVFLTRLADERIWLDMLESGAYDLLQKPYRAEDLRWVVCSALKHTA